MKLLSNWLRIARQGRQHGALLISTYCEYKGCMTTGGLQF
jgi:hypothetical protein